MYNPHSANLNYDFSTMYSAPLYDAIDPHTFYTATQPVNWSRSFFSMIENAKTARSGVMPNVTLEEINKVANYSFDPPSKDTIDTYNKLAYLGQGGNAGLIGRDVDRYAQIRATLGYGANPYMKLTKPLLENMSPEEARKATENNPLFDYFVENNPAISVDPETGERYYVDAGGKRTTALPTSSPAVKLNDKYISNKSPEWKKLSDTMLSNGTLYRWQKSLEAEGSYANKTFSLLPSLIDNLDTLGYNYIGKGAPPSIEQLTQEALGDVSLAAYENGINPFSSAGMDDIKQFLEPTEDEKRNGFDSNKWWNERINPEVVPFLNEKGINQNFILGARGSREALAKIQLALSESTIQQRMGLYSQENPWKAGMLATLAYSLPNALLNDPDMAYGIGLELITLGASTAVSTGLKGLQLTVNGTKNATKIAKILETVKASKLATVGKGIHQLAMGDLPLWFKNYSYLQKVGLGAGIAGAVNAGADVRDQLNKISFASTVLYNNNQDEFSLSEVFHSFGIGALFGGAIGTVAHAFTPSIGNKKFISDGKKLVDAETGVEKTLLNATPQQATMTSEGIKASVEEMSTVGTEKPTDILSGTGKDLKENKVEVIDQRGNRISVQEEDIMPISEVSEKILTGEYKVVRDQRTRTDVAIRSELEAPKEIPTTRVEEVPLNKGEKHLVDTERFADAADTARRAREGTLAEATESTALDRLPEEGDVSFAGRLIRSKQVKTLGDLMKVVKDKSGEQRTLVGKLVAFRRQAQSVKNTVAEAIKLETLDAETLGSLNSNLEKLDKFINEDINSRLVKALETGNTVFNKLPLDKQKAMVDFIIEHAGKSDAEIKRVLKENKTFASNEKRMLENRLVEKKTRQQRRKILDQILADKSISEESRKILNVVIGTPENLTLLQRKAASKAFRNERYFNLKSSYLTGEFYLDVKSLVDKTIDTLLPSQKTNIKENYDLVLSIMRSALINIKLPERAGLTRINLELKDLGKNTFGSNKLDIKADGSTSLTITIDKNKLTKALIEGDTTLIAHTILHELGHAYSYFASPKDVLQIMVKYTEFLDPAVLSAFVDLTDQIRSRGVDNQVGLYGAINPGEVFANYFANKGIATSLDVTARLKLSFLESFTSYISEVIESISESFTFNNTIQRKLKNISKTLNDIVENISTSNTYDISLIDMITVERTFTNSLVNMSFYDKNKTTYIVNLEKLISDGFMKRGQRTRTKLILEAGKEIIVEDISVYSEVIDEILQKENPDLFNNRDFSDFWKSLNGIEKYNVLKNPNEMLKLQLSSEYFSSQAIPMMFHNMLKHNYKEAKQKIYDIVQLAELTSTRVALERFLNNRNSESFKSYAELQKAIKEQGTYISSNLNKYLSSKLFIESQTFDNWTLLTKLLEQSKSKEILRKNTFELVDGRVIYRPTFDTGLDETSLVLYHGGTWTGAKAPIMLHAGTLQAAFDRVRKLIGYRDDYNMVAFEISKEANIIEMVDTGTQHTSFDSYWSGINDSYIKTPDATIEQVLREIVVNRKTAQDIINRIKETNRSIKATPQDLQKILKEAGVDIIRYKNSSEDMGSTSFIVVNPNIISVKANGKFDSITNAWQWKSRSTGKVLENTSKDLLDINYRGSESLKNIISLLPDLHEVITDFSEAISIQKDTEFTPTTITEVTPETKPILLKELNDKLESYFKLDDIFYRRLASGLRKKTGRKFMSWDARNILVDVLLKSKENSIDKGKIPVILTVDSEQSLFRVLFQYAKLGVLEDYKAQAKDGKVVSLETFGEGKAVEEGINLDEEVMAGMANKNNEPVGEGELSIDKLRQALSNYSNWLQTKTTQYGQEAVQDLLNLMGLRLELSKLTKGYKPGEIPKLPAGAGLELYFKKLPEERAVYNEALKANNEEVVKQIKKKSTSLVTRIQKLEKKLQEEFKGITDKPTEIEGNLHDDVLKKVASSEESVTKVQETKTENIEKDVAQAEENTATITAKEETPEIAAPVIKGLGEKESFISSNWDGNPEGLDLGGIFTTEKKAAGLRKKLNGKYTTRVELNKSKVLRVVSSAPSVFQSIKNLPEPILRLAGINKATMERVLGAVQKEHSEQEALRVVLHKLNEEGYTAIELVGEQIGKYSWTLIGHIPTSKDHIKVVQVLDHSKEKSVGYVSPDKLREKKTVQKEVDKPTIATEPKPVAKESEVVSTIKEGTLEATEPTITTRESDIPVISEEERFVHSVLNATETLRWNGTTPKIIKITLQKFFTAAKELRENIGVNLTGIPDEFKALLYKVTRVAEEIAEENRTRFGDLYETLNTEFWTIFDREVAKELLNRGTPGKELSVKSINEIIDFAHAKINENITNRNTRDGTKLPEFLKPIGPDDFEFTSSAITNKMPDGVKFKKDSLASSMDMRIEKRIEDELRKPEEPLKETPKEPEEDEVSKAVVDAVSNKPNDNTMLLRESTFIGWLFGGSQRDSRNKWRKFMNGLVNVIEFRPQTAKTSRSLSNIVRTLSAFADNTKAHIHNLVGGGKNAIKSWEQCSHETWRMISSIREAAPKLMMSLGNEKLYDLLSIEIMKSFATKTPLDRTKLENIIKTIIPTPSREYLDTNITNITALHNSVAEVNKTLIDLENETGFISLLDKDGNPIKPTEYYPITFIGDFVTRENESTIIDEMVKVRLATLNASDKLDQTVMLSMGWFYNKEGYILDRGRSLEGRQQHFLDESNFDAQTLINLEERRYPAGTNPRSMIEFKGEASNRHFTYVDKKTKEVVVCRLPKDKTDLSIVDLAKYNEVINGSTAYLGKQWKANFSSEPVLRVMMQDLLHSKLYRGKYSKDLALRRGSPTTPILALTDNARIEHGSVIPNLSWEEILSSDALVKITRHDPLEAYTNFTKSRGFELLVQKEVDRMLGMKGVRFGRFMKILYEEARKEAYAVGGDTFAANIAAGFDRLANDYLAYQGRLSSIQTRGDKLASEATEIGLGTVRGLSGTMWGITGTAEPLQHLIMSPFTVGPMQAVKNLWETVRILVGDKRFSTSAALRDELTQSIFFMDLVRTDLEDRILNIDMDGMPRMGRWFDRLKARREDASAIGRGIDIFGNVGVEIGSSRYTTFLARKLAMQRFSKRFADYINNGAAERFFTKLLDPTTNAKMRALEEVASTDPKAAKELTKMFKEISRTAGFGGRWDIAMDMNKFGINTVEKITALKKLFDKLGPQYSKDGLIHWPQLRALIDEHSKSPLIPDLDPKIAKEAYESLIFATETKVSTEGAVSTSRGLNRDLRIEGRTPMGRMFKSLLGWSQSFYNNVLGNFGGIKGSALFGSMVLYTGLTAASEYLKEWIQGRDWEDVREEMRRNPETFLFRMMNNLPVMGHLTGNLQYVLAKINESNGGPLRAFRSPMAAPAYEMSVGQPFRMAGSLYNLVTSSIPKGEGAQAMADVGNLTGINNLLNNSPVAIPARLLVEGKFINEADALGRYMKLIQKKKNSYLKGFSGKYSGPNFELDKELRQRLIAEALKGRRSQ